MRALVVVLALSAVAYADPLRVPNDRLDTPEAFQLPTPEGLRAKLDREAVFERAAMFERAIVATTDKRARANLVLAMGDLWTGYALYEDDQFLITQDLDRHIAAELALDRAKVHYRQIATDATLRGWPNLENALVHYAYVLRRKHESTTLPLERLLADVPAAHYAPYAQLALGDEAMWQHAPDRALKYYAAAGAVEFPYRAIALYKQALIELHTKNRANVAFELIGRAVAEPGHERIPEQLQQAFVVAFVKLGSPADAFEAFVRTFPDHATEMLEEAATQWHRLGKYSQSIAARRELLRRAPSDPRACEWEATIARLANANGDYLELLAAAERLVRRFQTTRDEACGTLAQDITLANARMFGHNALLHRTNDSVIIAERLYDLFLHGFPQHEQFATARMEMIRLRARRK